MDTKGQLTIGRVLFYRGFPAFRNFFSPCVLLPPPDETTENLFGGTWREARRKKKGFLFLRKLRLYLEVPNAVKGPS